MVGETAAPAVVAVVVACNPGRWFDETLRSLADQDYAHLAVLVAVVGDDPGTTERVKAVLPHARLAQFQPGTGFAAAANGAMAMVSGVAHILLCHDDIALASDSVRLLLEEAYRSNAGLTCPKCLLWDAPDRLLSVGMGADRLGVVHSLVEPGELDQGQHDAVREVFVAPSGAVLVRTDLWRALGGFDPAAGEPGEDLDISWRAQLAGARVVVAPQAMVRHLEATKNGLRPGRTAEVSREEHRFRDVWICYSPPGLVLVAPVALFFAVAETIWALLHRRSRRDALVPFAALARSFRSPGRLWVARRRAQVMRRANDLAIWKVQSRGSARLRAVLRSRLEKGHELAWAASRAASSRAGPAPKTAPLEAAPATATNGARGTNGAHSHDGHDGHDGADGADGASVTEGSADRGSARRQGATVDGSEEASPVTASPVTASPVTAGPTPESLATGEPTQEPARPEPGVAGAPATVREEAPVRQAAWARDEARARDEAEVRDRGAGSEPPTAATRPRLGWRWTAAAMSAVVILLLIGSRDVLSQSLPLVGQLPSGSGGVGEWWRVWWSGPGAGGLGGTSFSPPGLFLMGALGMVALGSANAAIHLMVFAPLLLGPLGVYVGARPFGSERGRLAATVLYAALPVPYNALAQGHWAGLVAYAAAPWLISGLCSLGGQAPYTFWHWDDAWPRFLGLGLGLALAASLAPALLVLVPAVGAAFCLASLLAGRHQGAVRLLLGPLIVAAVAVAALAPWSLFALRSWSTLVGAQPGTLPPLDLSQVLRLQTGPYGGGALSWALVVAAAISVFIGRSWRLAWAARLWLVALVCMALAWSGSRGWLPVPDLEVLLAPAGAALVFAVALGAAAVETDLSGYRFGWRQFAPPFGALAALAVILPLFAWVGNGQWSLPPSGAEEAFAFPPASTAGDYRVLWLGSPGSLPLAPQGSADGLSFATSLDGLPSADQLWAPRPTALSAAVAHEVAWAGVDQTTSLGRLLAPVAVRYIVVAVGPGAAGTASTRMVAALDRQVDLVPIGLDPSYEVFANNAWLPLFSVLASNASAAQLAAAAAPRDQWDRALASEQLDLGSTSALSLGASGTGTSTVMTSASANVLFGSVAPGSWRAAADGHTLVSRAIGGSATSWVLPVGRDTIAVARAGSGGQHLADLFMFVLWAVALWAARRRIRVSGRGQFSMVNLELGSPSADVLEIDWSSVLDGQNVG